MSVETHIEQLETPALVADLNILEANIARLASYAKSSGLHLRPHTKTHKTPAIAKMQIAAGGEGITVAKTGEAEVMAAAGLNDILLAYPIFGEQKLGRLATLALSNKISIAIDNAATVAAISRAAQSAGSTIDLRVELDAGMRRCGVATAEEAVTLAKLIDASAGVRFAGLNFYPGHISVPPADQAEPLQTLSTKIADVVDRLTRSGLACEVVSGGSTPTALRSHTVAGVTEIRPGTYVFNDRNTVAAGACSLDDCALRVLVTVVSTAVPGRAIIDGGSKTFSSDRLLGGKLEGFGGIDAYPDILFEGMSEEHGHLNVSTSTRGVQVGDRLSVLPNHVCACVNMHDRIYYHRNGIVEHTWQVAGRGRVV